MLVKQAANVIEILEYFVQRKRPATLSEISDDLGWPRSSTFNLVGTLADKGYLYEPRSRGGYYPSPRWLTTAQSLADAEPLPEALLSLVREIVKETGETTSVCAPSGTHAVMIHVFESIQSIRYYAHVGSRVPIYASSAGRALLAQYAPHERLSIYKKIKFEHYTETTPVSIETLEEELRRAHERGYHQSHSEYIPDLAGVALPLPLPYRKLSIVVAGPVSRCLEKRAAIAEIMIKGLQRFSKELDIKPVEA
ncbi:IclR family transcriptional regulator [Kordiimonas pumila]|uniref:IclR family transcriptional regulator n=1 Tax=Kordiimonas pumila TaxID=2161677 RepID=A0ABV7D5C4_9PROT|nr:IclR family transcriptional regulator [Kordiimonas pumila]